MMEKKWLFGSFFTTSSYAEVLKKLNPKKIDFISQGYVPKFDAHINSEKGILYSWENIPLGLWDVPTLNGMVFSKKLWNDIHENVFVKASLENHCLWGEDQHREDAETFWNHITIRVNDFWCDDHNLVLGNVDLMDTPAAIPIYNCGKTGATGNSSRGFGDLRDRSDGLQDVVEDEYSHVCWDSVTFPAVPNCLSMRTTTEETQKTSPALEALTKELFDSVEVAHQNYPEDDMISQLYDLVNSSLQKKNAKFPSVDAIKKLFA